MTKKTASREERKRMAEMLRGKDGFERRPGTEPARILLAAKPKKKRAR